MLRCRETERRAGIEISIIAWAENRQVACLAEIPYLKKGSQVDVFGTSGGCFGGVQGPIWKIRRPRVDNFSLHHEKVDEYLCGDHP